MMQKSQLESFFYLLCICCALTVCSGQTILLGLDQTSIEVKCATNMHAYKNKCLLNIPNCQAYFEGSSCSKCQPNYDLVRGKCILHSSRYRQQPTQLFRQQKGLVDLEESIRNFSKTASLFVDEQLKEINRFFTQNYTIIRLLYSIDVGYVQFSIAVSLNRLPRTILNHTIITIQDGYNCEDKYRLSKDAPASRKMQDFIKQNFLDNPRPSLLECCYTNSVLTPDYIMFYQDLDVGIIAASIVRAKRQVETDFIITVPTYQSQVYSLFDVATELISLPPSPPVPKDPIPTKVQFPSLFNRKNQTQIPVFNRKIQSSKSIVKPATKKQEETTSGPTEPAQQSLQITTVLDKVEQKIIEPQTEVGYIFASLKIEPTQADPGTKPKTTENNNQGNKNQVQPAATTNTAATTNSSTKTESIKQTKPTTETNPSTTPNSITTPNQTTATNPSTTPNPITTPNQATATNPSTTPNPTAITTSTNNSGSSSSSSSTAPSPSQPSIPKGTETSGLQNNTMVVSIEQSVEPMQKLQTQQQFRLGYIFTLSTYGPTWEQKVAGLTKRSATIVISGIKFTKYEYVIGFYQYNNKKRTFYQFIYQVEKHDSLQCGQVQNTFTVIKFERVDDAQPADQNYILFPKKPIVSKINSSINFDELSKFKIVYSSESQSIDQMDVNSLINGQCGKKIITPLIPLVVNPVVPIVNPAVNPAVNPVVPPIVNPPVDSVVPIVNPAVNPVVPIVNPAVNPVITPLVNPTPTTPNPNPKPTPTDQTNPVSPPTDSTKPAPSTTTPTKNDIPIITTNTVVTGPATVTSQKVRKSNNNGGTNTISTSAPYAFDQILVVPSSGDQKQMPQFFQSVTCIPIGCENLPRNRISELMVPSSKWQIINKTLSSISTASRKILTQFRDKIIKAYTSLRVMPLITVKRETSYIAATIYTFSYFVSSPDGQTSYSIRIARDTSVVSPDTTQMWIFLSDEGPIKEYVIKNITKIQNELTYNDKRQIVGQNSVLLENEQILSLTQGMQKVFPNVLANALLVDYRFMDSTNNTIKPQEAAKNPTRNVSLSFLSNPVAKPDTAVKSITESYNFFVGYNDLKWMKILKLPSQVLPLFNTTKKEFSDKGANSSFATVVFTVNSIDTGNPISKSLSLELGADVMIKISQITKQSIVNKTNLMEPVDIPELSSPWLSQQVDKIVEKYNLAPKKMILALSTKNFFKFTFLKKPEQVIVSFWTLLYQGYLFVVQIGIEASLTTTFLNYSNIKRSQPLCDFCTIAQAYIENYCIELTALEPFYKKQSFNDANELVVVLNYQYIGEEIIFTVTFTSYDNPSVVITRKPVTKSATIAPSQTVSPAIKLSNISLSDQGAHINEGIQDYVVVPKSKQSKYKYIQTANNEIQSLAIGNNNRAPSEVRVKPQFIWGANLFYMVYLQRSNDVFVIEMNTTVTNGTNVNQEQSKDKVTRLRIMKATNTGTQMLPSPLSTIDPIAINNWLIPIKTSSEQANCSRATNYGLLKVRKLYNSSEGLVIPSEEEVRGIIVPTITIELPNQSLTNVPILTSEQIMKMTIQLVSSSENNNTKIVSNENKQVTTQIGKNLNPMKQTVNPIKQTVSLKPAKPISPTNNIEVLVDNIDNSKNNKIELTKNSNSSHIINQNIQIGTNTMNTDQNTSSLINSNNVIIISNNSKDSINDKTNNINNGYDGTVENSTLPNLGPIFANYIKPVTDVINSTLNGNKSNANTNDNNGIDFNIVASSAANTHLSNLNPTIILTSQKDLTKLQSASPTVIDQNYGLQGFQYDPENDPNMLLGYIDPFKGFVNNPDDSPTNFIPIQHIDLFQPIKPLKPVGPSNNNVQLASVNNSLPRFLMQANPQQEQEQSVVDKHIEAAVYYFLAKAGAMKEGTTIKLKTVDNKQPKDIIIHNISYEVTVTSDDISAITSKDYSPHIYIVYCVQDSTTLIVKPIGFVSADTELILKTISLTQQSSSLSSKAYLEQIFGSANVKTIFWERKDTKYPQYIEVAFKHRVFGESVTLLDLVNSAVLQMSLIDAGYQLVPFDQLVSYVQETVVDYFAPFKGVSTEIKAAKKLDLTLRSVFEVSVKVSSYFFCCCVICDHKTSTAHIEGVRALSTQNNPLAMNGLDVLETMKNLDSLVQLSVMQVVGRERFSEAGNLLSQEYGHLIQKCKMARIYINLLLSKTGYQKVEDIPEPVLTSLLSQYESRGYLLLLACGQSNEKEITYFVEVSFKGMVPEIKQFKMFGQDSNSMSHCLMIDQLSASCVLCQAGYYRSLGGQCFREVKNCRHEMNDFCLTCRHGYTLSSNKDCCKQAQSSPVVHA